jgi:hypothetical protein
MNRRTDMWMVPIILTVVVLAAHFLRDGSHAVTVLLIAMLPLLALRRRWVARLFQGVLLFGAVTWMMTTAEILRFRAEAGQPYTRMTVILGAVTFVTAASALLFETRRAKARYLSSPVTHNPVSTS